MRKVMLNLAVSLDGFIEGPNGEFDWCFTDQDYGMMDFMNRIDVIFIGRKSYELVLQMGKHPYSDKLKYVFSKTIKNVRGNTKLISQNIEEEVKKVIDQEGKDIWLFGGANLVTSFLNSGLVDEIHLAVHPIILGKGKPLFEEIKERKYFKLVDTKTYSSGLVQLFYETDKN
ncbi:MAG: dihydrofolate reductase [Bacteroidetes bacterium]|nr:dihydrofolate reductase [Bacteroidota bacterium]